MISRARSSNFCLGGGPCAHLTLTFSGSVLVLHCLPEPFGWPLAGCLDVNKCAVFCRNIKRNIKRYWISRRLCRSISCKGLRRLRRHTCGRNRPGRAFPALLLGRPWVVVPVPAGVLCA